MSGVRSLTRDEARERAALLQVERYDLELDMTGLASGDTLRTTSRITFSATAPGATTFVDCLGEVEEAVLNGRELRNGTPPQGRIELPDPIKTVGKHSVSIKLHPQVTATVSVEVAATT